MAKILFANNVATTTTGVLNIGDVTLAVNNDSSFPTISGSDYFYLTIYDLSGTVEQNVEIVKVTAKLAPNVYTIVRAQEGTADQAHITGSLVEMRYTKGQAEAFAQNADVAVTGGTIAGTDITVGAGKTLNVSAGTLTLADNQISGDKVEGGTIAATTITTLTSTTANVTTLDTNVAAAGVTLAGTTLAADGTDADINITITPKGTGAVVMSKVDIGGGTISAATFTNGYTEETFSDNAVDYSTIALTNGTIQTITLDQAATTLTFPANDAGKSFLLIIKQDGTGSRTITWDTDVKWPSGTAPTLTATASKADVFSFVCDGTYWYGVTVGQNYL